MGIYYSIKVHSDKSRDQLASVIISVGGFVIDSSHGGRSPTVETTTLRGSVFSIDVRAASHLEREIFADELNIDINHSLLIFPSPEWANEPESAAQLVSVVCQLLNNGAGDLVFLFSGEQVLLIRKDGLVSISQTAGFWNDRSTSALSVPYTKASLPSI